ncbi:MAG: T9SS type A sorting domain-containing protein [Bacteroidales bacterium]|jgi:hypothetical protein
MHNRKIVLLGLISLLGSWLCEVHGQWTPVNPPGSSANVTAFFTYGQDQYISTPNGLYSADSVSGFWKYLGPYSFKQFAVKGDSLLYQNSNGGISILDLNNIGHVIDPLMVGGFDFHSMMLDQGRVFVAHYYGGFYIIRPDNQGFYMINTGLPKDTIWFAHDSWSIEHPVTCAVKCGTWFIAQTRHGLYKASTSSVIWSKVGNQGSTFQSTLLYGIGEELYGIRNNRIYLSMDIGETWTDLGYAGSAAITTVFKSENAVYLGTVNDGVYRKFQDQAQWARLSIFPAEQSVNLISQTGSTLVCGSTLSGFQYLSGTTTWVQNNAGIALQSDYRNLMTHHGKLFAWNNHSLYSSVDQGRIWNESPINFGEAKINNIVSLGNSLVAQGRYLRKLIYSLDDGETWVDISDRIPIKANALPGDYILRSIGSRLFMSYDFNRELYYTDNLGASWTDISFPSQFCNSLSLIGYKSTTFALFCHYGQVARLINDQWVLTNNGLPADQSPESFYSCGDQLYININARGWYVYDETTSTWSPASLALDENLPWNWRPLGSEDYFYYYSQGWVISHDCLQSIRSMDTEGLLNKTDTYPIVCLNDTLYLVQGTNGIWKRPIDQLSSDEEEEIHSDPILVFPNPAADYLQISGLPNDQEVTVSLLDMTGRSCEQLILSGEQSININGLAPGIYFLRIRYAAKSVLKRVAIMR